MRISEESQPETSFRTQLVARAYNLIKHLVATPHSIPRIVHIQLLSVVCFMPHLSIVTLDNNFEP